MAKRSTNGALAGLQSAAFDPNGLGENIATDQAGMQKSDAYYQGQEAKDFGNVQATAEDWRQHGAAIAPGDPQGLRLFTQALHDRGAVITPHSGFMASPFETEQRSTIFDPTRQTSAVDPVQALAGLSRKRKY